MRETFKKEHSFFATTQRIGGQNKKKDASVGAEALLKGEEAS